MSLESPQASALVVAARPGRSFWADAWVNFRRRKLAMLALTLVASLGLVAIFSP